VRAKPFRFPLARIVEIVAFQVAASDGEEASTRYIRHRMGDRSQAAPIGDQPGQGVDQAKTLVGTGQQRHRRWN
jgi:hypothetical protein